MVAEIVFVIKSAAFPSSGQTGMMNTSADAAFGSVEEVATLLFTKYLYPFELTSILLLAAIVGAVVMARGRQQDGQTDNEVSNEGGE
jgi:NADH-quinone oxidoreductase subunit J